MASLDELLLRDFAPHQQVVLPRHEVTRAAVPAIDAHTHLGRWLSAWVDREGQWLVTEVEPWLERMERSGVHGFVNLDGRWGCELAANLERFDAAHPGRFATFAHLDWSVLETDPAGCATALRRQVEDAHAAGAAGLKVWKDLGLGQRDHRGDLVLPDDPRVAGVWAAAGELDLPVWWHTADPVSFFDPVDEHNENVEILAERPDWSFHGEGFPGFDRLMEALETVVAGHPGTVFVAVHGGCYAENLGWVDRMLTSYPNLHIDIAARLAQLGRQPRATRELIMRHPDRVLFGSDEIPPQGETYPTYFRFLETADECFPHTPDPDDPGLGRWTISGLELPVEVLEAVYAGNVRRLVPRLAR
jgi:predicted TIM-barrel fold metal-dependent hydrolase